MKDETEYTAGETWMERKARIIREYAEGCEPEPEEPTGIFGKLLGAVAAATLLPVVGAVGYIARSTEPMIELPRDEVSRVWGLLGHELRRTKG